MDSYRDTTIISDDEDEDSSVQSDSDQESSDDFARKIIPPPQKNKARRRIISESEDEQEVVGDTANEIAEVNVSHQEDEVEGSDIANISQSGSETDELEDEFMKSNRFNSTAFLDDNFSKNFVPPTEPEPEEVQELMKSIYEQETKADLRKSLSISRKSRSSLGIKQDTSNADIINSTNSISGRQSLTDYHNETEISSSISRNNVSKCINEDNTMADSIKLVEPTLEEIIISDSDDDDGNSQGLEGIRQPSPFKKILAKHPVIRQPTLPEMIKKTPSVEAIEEQIQIVDSTDSPVKKVVSRMEYVQKKQNLENINLEKRKLDMAMRTIQLDKLPDKGRALLNKQAEMVELIKEAQDELANINVKDETVTPITWGGLEAGTTDVQPRTFGKQAIQTYNNEKALTLDRLHNLHNSLKSCPTPETVADDPDGLKVNLMLHQKHALAWLLWREMQKPAGGILADDMGLGKTLTMISLIAAHNQMREDADEESDDENENEENQRQFKYTGGTLVVCPASLLSQWTNEVEDKLKRNMMSVETYHGPKRETKAKRLSKYDMVVTTYAICVSEGESDTALYRIKWDRIILDEAHQIRNHKAKTALAVFRLAGKRRWALTGTPVHNKEMDLFALLKFLRCSPFDDVAIFKRWISAKSGGGHQRLHTVLSSMLLRRTKEQLKELDQLTCLPEREWQLVEIQMDKDEMDVYQKILLFSKTLFAQFLHQRAEKNADSMQYDGGIRNMNDPSNEYYKMHKKLVTMNKLPEVKQSDILVLLLRLRQICCHPSLITAMLDNVADLGDDDGASDADVSIDLLDQLNKMNIDDNENGDKSVHELNLGGEGVGLAEASRNFLNRSNPVFHKDRQSSKVREVMKLLQDTIPSDDKTIIVSQWTSLLHLMVCHLEALNIRYCQLDGTIPVKSRGEIVYNFNNPKSGIQIMLLSLTAGGVGLNLVGANHLVFMDLHWNPQLEMQAQDRIYRVGQRKKVFIYKLMTVSTIEQRIKCLQDKKKEIADAMLKGAKMNASKLSLADLKMLFDM